MSTAKLKSIEEKLRQLTANHKPELSVQYMNESGQKLKNHDKDTADITLITDKSSEEVYAFMRRVLGKDPFIVE